LIQQIEIDIQKLLREKKDLKNINELIWQKWHHSNFDEFSINSYCSFLFESKEWNKIIYLSIMQLKRQAPVSWDYLAACINGIKDLKLRDDTIKSCLQFFLSPDYEIPYLKTLVFDGYEPAAPDWRAFHRKQLKTNQLQTKNKLIEQLQMFKHSSQFSEHEKNTLIKIEKMYPNDPDISAIIEVAKSKEIKNILEKYGKNYLPQNEISTDEKQFIARLKKVLFNDCSNWIKNKNYNAFDFVYVFIFMEAYPEAIALLELIDDSTYKNGLLLDLLMLDRRFSYALAFTDQMEKSLLQIFDLEKMSHIYYQRSRCLWELGRKDAALAAIEYLIRFNPEYRLANHLLYEWRSAI
jgi:hypothetical protein